ncbi:hypothetical protein BpHYR1_004152 [Brachionus plicatilis]|uniref:Uncharacterized protein n=1 Tax=Brachionus plicatilis TaxID=10195 RepID=A0A3M7SY19_BRAPC|nr:hypothetical protein BpHYR1_004152 [Brachionus plicatilis]
MKWKAPLMQRMLTQFFQLQNVSNVELTLKKCDLNLGRVKNYDRTLIFEVKTMRILKTQKRTEPNKTGLNVALMNFSMEINVKFSALISRTNLIDGFRSFLNQFD